MCNIGRGSREDTLQMQLLGKGEKELSAVVHSIYVPFLLCFILSFNSLCSVLLYRILFCSASNHPGGPTVVNEEGWYSDTETEAQEFVLQVQVQVVLVLFVLGNGHHSNPFLRQRYYAAAPADSRLLPPPPAPPATTATAAATATARSASATASDAA